MRQPECHAHVDVADAADRSAARGAASVDCPGLGQVERGAPKYAEVLIGVIAHGRVELKNLVGRIDGPLEAFSFGESPILVGGRGLGDCRRAHRQCHEQIEMPENGRPHLRKDPL